MRCSSCGERLAATDERCPLCGAAVDLAPFRSASDIRRCPRCRYAGEGIGYFRRPGHLVLLTAVSLFTWGIGGVVYWLLRRKHSVCPNCGLSWPAGGYALAPAPERAEARRPEPALPSGGMKRRLLGVALALFSTALVGGGLVGGEPPAVVAGCVFGLAGTGVFFWGWRALQERRSALRQALERQVLWLASRKGGALTATDVASDLDLSLAAAEGVLFGMDDGFRVRSDVTQEGVIVFEFPEVRHRRLSG